jgi:tRNA-2-methylthio-N6-dimethylallyladenosine synthase
MNEHDSERLAGLLESDGMTHVDGLGLNTCCIRENADDKFYGTLSQLKNWKTQKDDRQILVAGCLAQKDRDAIRKRAPYVDVVIGTHNVHRAAELLDQTRNGKPVTEILEEAVIDDHSLFPSALPMRREVSYNAWVTIQIGCDNTCAYCIVPAVRGKEISRPQSDILAEVESLARSGVTQISLIGQNVNSYGRYFGQATTTICRTVAQCRCGVGHLEGSIHESAPKRHARRHFVGNGRDTKCR